MKFRHICYNRKDMILYLPVNFKLEFEKPAFVDNHIQMVIRSLIGKNLKSMSCSFDKVVCNNCLVAESCIYAKLFETVVEKNSAPIKGTNRASHPYAVTKSDDVKLYSKIKSYNFQITFFGSDCESNFSYISEALKKAGMNGMFKERVKFSVQQSVVEDKTNDSLNTCVFDENVFKGEGGFRRLEVSLDSPLRFQIDGKYAADFSSLEFFRCLNRRYRIMMALYGSEIFLYEGIENTKTKIIQKDLRWVRRNRYSARQDKQMKFDGLYGTFILEGDFSDYELMLLKFAEIANAGKSSNFGCGIVTVR